jgi:flagellar biosynthesis chaperone FliJ
MISKEEIERLAQVRSESGVASAYVGISPRFMYDLDHHITQAKSALKRAERQLTRSEWREALTREGERILQFLETWQPRGRGIVIFSSEPANIWEVVPLEMYVPS